MSVSIHDYQNRNCLSSISQLAIIPGPYREEIRTRRSSVVLDGFSIQVIYEVFCRENNELIGRVVADFNLYYTSCRKEIEVFAFLIIVAIYQNIYTYFFPSALDCQ